MFRAQFQRRQLKGFKLHIPVRDKTACLGHLDMFPTILNHEHLTCYSHSQYIPPVANVSLWSWQKFHFHQRTSLLDTFHVLCNVDHAVLHTNTIVFDAPHVLDGLWDSWWNRWFNLIVPVTIHICIYVSLSCQSVRKRAKIEAQKMDKLPVKAQSSERK